MIDRVEPDARPNASTSDRGSPALRTERDVHADTLSNAVPTLGESWWGRLVGRARLGAATQPAGGCDHALRASCRYTCQTPFRGVAGNRRRVSPESGVRSLMTERPENQVAEPDGSEEYVPDEREEFRAATERDRHDESDSARRRVTRRRRRARDRNRQLSTQSPWRRDVARLLASALPDDRRARGLWPEPAAIP